MNRDSHYRSLLVLTLLGVGFLLFPNVVVACALAPKPTVLQAYDESDVVIIARAISVEKLSDRSEKPMIGILVSSTTMQVEKVFKGNLRAGDKIVWPGEGKIDGKALWTGEDDELDPSIYVLSRPKFGVPSTRRELLKRSLDARSRS